MVAARGPSVVALVTGEERIVPERVKYWVCTTEAMPQAVGADFVALDEIQLCADPERGHVFTERLLRARGLHETLFLGSDTMRGAIAALVPKAQFTRRERFSSLTGSGSKKLSRMPERSAIVGFSVDNVYAIAEPIRHIEVRRPPGAARSFPMRSARSPVSPAEHATLLARIYGFLADPSHVPDDWLATQIARARPQRRRHRYPVEAAGLCPHLELCRATQRLGPRRKPLARPDARCRRPPVGCAARAR